MRVDFGAKLLNMDGSVMQDMSPQGPVEATLGRAVVGAMLAPVDSKDAMEKIRRVKLAQLAYEQREAEITEDEAQFIRVVLGETLQYPLVVARCFELLGA